jgi:transposase
MKCVRKVSQVDSFVKGFEQKTWWVGLDVHRRSYAVALRRADGQIHTWTSTPDPHALLTTFQRCGIQPALVVHEAGPTGYHLARVLGQAGIEVRIGAPSRIPRPVSPGAKSDRLDCQRLAEYAARDMIVGIAVPTNDEEILRALVRRRQKLTDQIRACKQRIRALLLYHDDVQGVDLPSWSAAHVEMLFALELPLVLRALLESHFVEMSNHETIRANIDQQIEAVLRAYPVWEERFRMFRTVPGIGPRAAMTFLAEIFQPERFTRAEEVSSYIGLAPMVHHSGEKTPPGRLRPVGQKRLRALLVEAAWRARTIDPGFASIYNRVLSRNGQTQKAVVAVARRLGIILWRIALEQRPYYPIPPNESVSQ